MRTLLFDSSKCDKIHQEWLRLPETGKGALPFPNTALVWVAAEGNGFLYKLPASFLIIRDSKACLTEISYDMR